MRRFLPSPPGVFLKSSSICWFLTIFILFVLLVLCWLSVVLVLFYLHAIIYLRMALLEFGGSRCIACPWSNIPISQFKLFKLKFLDFMCD